ncbi:hypothetical protein [Falsiroseomonas oryzae]|uniref:hypothetical protein n=1 Tax=Falsiroseomonas oryzae TaxID=2766473 RepID=UPI0022EB0C65|nr:hypothetical protein [Roseomonas sp. MO-31]
MDLVEAVTDRCIRRGLAFAGLAVATVMLALSFDLPLALRTGADLSAVVAVVILLVAWRTPHRDLRDSEAWVMLNELAPHPLRGSAKADLQQRLRETLRRRLIWHAERVGILAVALWGLTLASLLPQLL